ncbi:MAG: hypothetical protein LUI12_00015 [Clostridiales bacterium]|nr:hypothetical protein [Clostridiales bacterium]
MNEQLNNQNGDKQEADFTARSDRRDAERARKREERRKKVRRQKIAMAVSGVVILIAAAAAVAMFMTPVKFSRNMAKGEKYAAQADYASAQEAYEKALELDDTSVKAYHSLADLLTEQEKISQAESVVYAGWEKTGDETLLHYYCTLVLNEAVTEINDKNCTLDTVDRCLQVLELDAANEDALSLMHTCYERLFAATEEEEVCTLFFDSDIEEDTCGYDDYEQLLRRILAVYQASSSDEIREILAQYAVIDMPQVRITMTHAEQYAAVLSEINELLSDVQITETLACLARAQEILDYFAQAFEEFAQGNYAYARELIAEESYQELRDQFIQGTSGYWKGSVYIPVSQEQLVLNREEGEVTFSFLDYGEYDNPQGIITVWGSKQEDDGVQRSGISYEPASESGEEFPHWEYTVQYLYSNVKVDGVYVPQMNYRFDTKVTTEEGTTTTAVGDWGGEHEFEIDY